MIEDYSGYFIDHLNTSKIVTVQTKLQMLCFNKKKKLEKFSINTVGKSILANLTGLEHKDLLPLTDLFDYQCVSH